MTRPGGALPSFGAAERSGALADEPLEGLVAELLARVETEALADEASVALWLRLAEGLRRGLDVHENRFSATRYRDIFGLFAWSPGATEFPLEDATVVDLGCGSINPLGVAFLFVALGARRAFAVDPDPAEDPARAARALAECATLLLLEPTRILGRWAIPRERLLRNLESFDLARLAVGDLRGADPDRLIRLHDDAAHLSIGDAEADLVMSNALLEHLPDPDEIIAEMARISAPGALHVHSLDASDHRRYGDASVHPLEFLTEDPGASFVHSCNRLRPRQFVPLFEHRGFELEALRAWHVEVDDAFASRLVEPWASMPREWLHEVGATLTLRRPA